MKLDQKARRRFMDSFESGDENACWEWRGTKNNAGYPLFSFKGRMISATKTAYSIYYKRKIPKGWVVSHTCHNVACMNPDHLYITSRSDLTKELYESGRMKPANQKGADNPNSKLTEDDVREIRRRKEEGATHMELAEEYGVTKTTISQIYNRKLWSHVA
jgi:DNA-binding XRE family transcriptional regulator